MLELVNITLYVLYCGKRQRYLTNAWEMNLEGCEKCGLMASAVEVGRMKDRGGGRGLPRGVKFH